MAWTTLHVGLVGPLPPPSGGMANQTRQLRALLEGEGARVTLVQTNAPYRPAWVARLPVVRAAFRLLPYLAGLWRCAGTVEVMHVMANSGWSWHLFAVPAVWIARLRGTRVVVNYRGGEAPAFLARSARWVVPTLRRAHALAVPSAFLRETFAAHGVDAQILPNIVDLAQFRHDAAGADAGPPRIVVARNLEPIYDLATAIRAFAIVRATVPDAKLVIAGSGPDLARLQGLARDTGAADAVTFTGRLERAAMVELHRTARIALNPSLVDNMPNSVLEALASGVPVVSTNVGGVPYMVQDGVTALLVPAQDPEAMARAMLKVLVDPALARRLREAGLVDVQKYAWTEVRPRLLALYRPGAPMRDTTDITSTRA